MQYEPPDASVWQRQGAMWERWFLRGKVWGGVAAEVRLDALARENHNGVQSDHGSSSSLPGSTERVLKFELQMYKMREGEYCVDIQVCTQLDPR